MQEKYRNFKQIVNIFYNEEINEIKANDDNIKKLGDIRIEPQIYYDKFAGDMKIEFKIGNKKMYKIKNLAEFYTRIINREFYRYGERLQFVHSEAEFDKDSQELLSFIMKYAEIIKYANSNSNSNFKYYGKALNETNIIVGNSAIDDLFDVLEGKAIDFQKDASQEKIEFTKEQPKIEFKLKKVEDNQYIIEPNIEIYKVNIIKGKNYKYILDDKKMYRCTKELVIKVFLDFDKKDYLIADVKFCYEENEFNPLDEKTKLNFPRNMLKETKALNILRQTGFMLDVKNLRFILPDNDKIYEFLTQEIDYYMQQFDVLVTDNFKRKQIRTTKIGNIGVRVENNLLEIDLNNLDIDPEELEQIMERYSLKKKYHRLKDGSFIDLENSKEIEFLDKLATGMDISYKEIENGEINLPVYRSLYLNQLLKGIKGTEIVKNSEYKKIVNGLNKEQLEESMEVPEQLNEILRYYQKTGYKWLKTLDNYRFGGILADDMGLRKDNSNFICYSRLCTKK